MTVVDELRWKRHKDRRVVVVIAHGGSELEWLNHCFIQGRHV